MSDVGYKRPPRHTQFTPGRSGNPTGRPKGRRSFASDLAHELGEMISVRDGGSEVQVTKQHAIVKKLVATAMAGDAKAIAALIPLLDRVEDVSDQIDSAEDRAIVRAVQATAIRENTVKKIQSHEN